MILEFKRGKQHFAILREESPGGPLYVGYCNSRRSVTGPKPHVTARVLIKKHVRKAPAGKVLHFPEERHVEHVVELLPELEPDRVG